MHGLKPEFWFLVHASLCKGKREIMINIYLQGKHFHGFLFHTLQHKVLNDLLNIKNTLPINHSEFDLGLFELFANSHLFCRDINKISLKANLNEFQSLRCRIYYLATMLLLLNSYIFLSTIFIFFFVHYIIRSIFAIFDFFYPKLTKIRLNKEKWFMFKKSDTQRFLRNLYCLILCKYKVQRFVSEDLKLSQVIRAQELKLGDFMNDLLNARNYKI
ncbi:hypothetical protein BpHYR1_015201 [Brachionus plicatilis]|uniref:Uncharacterized protein n=1 Tax=Brachionus plicatilis TaxID=10195 RepID=A0A3M7Q3K9_BRAPC|nr:hypothetical protein BpHYR1_015201 [Brachionus plicatilis]